MSVGTAIAGDTLTRWLAGGCKLSLHSGEPGPIGQFRLLGPVTVAPGVFRVTGSTAANAREFELGTAERGGRARYVGFWLSDGRWLIGVRLERDLTLTLGQSVTVPRGALSLTLGAG